MRKVLTIISLIVVIFLQATIPVIATAEIDNAYIQYLRKADYHLKYWNSSKEMYTYIICSIVGFEHNGNFYPAYCMNSDLPGAETVEYSVNINDIINRDDIWRVVTHGYPYNNMGLSDDDAFVVTKMAVFCMLGTSDINSFYAEQDDATACLMLDRLKELVAIGNDETIDRNIGNIEVSKVNELKELDEYFYQEYSVSSDIELDKYEIKNFKDFPEGSFVANENNNAQTVFDTGNNFRVIMPKSGFENDINGSFEIEAKLKNYPVFYGEAPDGYQNYVITFDVFGNNSKNVNTEFQAKTGSIKVIKKDEESLEPLSNVKFELYDEEMNVIETLITDENGEVVSEKYPVLNKVYYLKEIETHEGFELDDEIREIKLLDGDTLEIEILNKKIPEVVEEHSGEPPIDIPVEPEIIEESHVEPEKEIIKEVEKEVIILRHVEETAKILPRTGI